MYAYIKVHMKHFSKGTVRKKICAFHPTVVHESPEGKQMYNSTLFLNSALDGCVVKVTPRPH
jgi:hypothetical protein